MRVTVFRGGAEDTMDAYLEVTHSGDGVVLAIRRGRVLGLWEPGKGWDWNTQRISHVVSPDPKELAEMAQELLDDLKPVEVLEVVHDWPKCPECRQVQQSIPCAEACMLQWDQRVPPHTHIECLNPSCSMGRKGIAWRAWMLTRRGAPVRKLAFRWFRSRGAAVSRTYRLRVLGVHPGGRTGYRLACRWEHEPNVVQLVDVEVGG